MRTTAWVIGIAALVGASSASADDKERGVWLQQSPIIFLPGQAEGGERQFKEGEAIITFPLRWALSTRLGTDVTLGQGETAFTLPAGSLLPAVLFREIGTNNKREAYCTRSRVAERKEGSGFLGHMVGGMFNNLQDKQVCLEDTDKDGAFDNIVVLGDGRGITEAGAIDPLPFKQLVAEPMGTSDDVAQVSMWRVGRSVVQLWLEVRQQGKSRHFTSMVSGEYVAQQVSTIRFSGKRAAPLYQFGVRYDVVDADTKASQATLRWQPMAPANDYIVIADDVTYTPG